MYFKSKVSASFVTMIVIGLVLVFSISDLKNYRRPDLIRHDMSSYYAYLPAFIIHQDLHLKFVQDDPLHHFSWVIQAENGPVFRMTMGVAILNLPAFLLADAISHIFNLPRTGFSLTYNVCLLLSAAFYMLLGLQYLRKTLRRYFRDWVVALTLIAVSLGTNLYYYSMDEPLMSHVFNFSLYAILLYHIESWHRKRSFSHAVFMALCMGMLTLIRPIHIFSVLLFLLYDAGNPKKWKQVLRLWWHLPLMGLIAFLVFVPQLFYWHKMSGSWLFYSYGEEGFFFNDPKILKGWFGFRKGFFIYTPVMLLIIPGFVLLFKKHRALFTAILPLFLVLSYVMFSWWCWWYGGSYGSRVMIDLYALLAIPLAAALQWLWMKRKLWRRVIPVGLVFLFCLFNFYKTWQYRDSLLHWDSMNFRLYKQIFLDSRFPENYDKMLTPPDYDAAVKGDR